MSVSRISVKFFIEDPEVVEMTAVVPVFHQWIREETVPGLLIDVADYKHVPAGPGIILIGHEADYALDNSDGRLGFLHRRKRLAGGSFAARFKLTVETAVQAARQFEKDTGWALQTALVEIAIPDRLQAPNTATTIAALENELHAVLADLVGPAEIQLTVTAVDERRPLTVQASLLQAPPLAAWAEEKVVV